MAASHELTFKDYQKQLRDNIKAIQDNFIDILKTNTEHINFELQVKSAEIVRAYQQLMQLVAEIRTFLIVNHQFQPPEINKTTDEKLVRLRDDMAMFLYELEIPLM